MKKILLLVIVLFGCFFLSGCEQKESKGKYDYLVLVNKYSKLPEDWEKNVELVKTKNAWDEDIEIEKEAFEKYKELKKDLKKDGVTIELDSVYRSVKEQQELWDNWSKDPEKGIEYVKKYVAVPGYSEHHTGLAVDICIKKDGKLIFENDDMIAEKKIFSKIHKKLADYGFILRYLDGRDDITGYAYEPWHLRYVGSSKIAKEIMDKDITFEEYLGSIKDIKNNSEAAKYQIEKTLEKEFYESRYKDLITNVRFDVFKIYTDEEIEKDDLLKTYRKRNDDIVFEVNYELMPAEGVDINLLMIPDGQFNEETGWVYDLHRVGRLVKNSKTGKYSVKDLGTGF